MVNQKLKNTQTLAVILGVAAGAACVLSLGLLFSGGSAMGVVLSILLGFAVGALVGALLGWRATKRTR
ncbi:hypothetical protein JCM3263A_18920 [Thermobifida fusca]|jgi:hypothetical protein|uniref:Lipoprotein n=1 Tax=Thermobifida fusca TM51 TaxID=1169414 RepID=A0A9P2T955_THEFU|nr:MULTISPECIES: hypothetical protein [Thermobifida]EOR69996.1 hypothetical protein TM51_14651 [Thermobifida fusca TM51]MBO2529941.1 hypothetical protein [Thermobifida sp.]PPS94546.1 hypothetical protein BH05_05460 [Thermobifida fusca]PZN62080.1 MAG: hypothetical protein DIU53_11495 [Thermobifida fusca]QOS59338.1 hypothetical protein IM867_02570 [Thermobifida fusca]